jgi:hypothetical protein
MEQLMGAMESLKLSDSEVVDVEMEEEEPIQREELELQESREIPVSGRGETHYSLSLVINSQRHHQRTILRCRLDLPQVGFELEVES